MRGIGVALTLLAGLAAAAAAQPAPLTLADAFFAKAGPGTANQVLLAPRIQLAGEPLPATGGGTARPLRAASSEACGALCLREPRCTAFQHCPEQGGCPHERAEPLAYNDCLLLSTNCTLQPAVVARDVLRTSGVPVRYEPPSVSGFVGYSGVGVSLGDFECPGSLLPGACAFSNHIDAAFACLRLSNCRTVVVYPNGTNSCSQPVAVLKTWGLVPSTTFISAFVYTLHINVPHTQGDDAWLQASRGQLSLPSADEQAELDSDPGAPGTWKGFFSAPNTLFEGQPLEVLADVRSVEECAQACFADSLAANRSCDAFNFCDAEGGCSYQSDKLNQELVSLQQWECELRHQELATTAVGGPPLVMAEGPSVPFYAGAPIQLWAPPVPGYDRLVGRSLVDFGKYACEDSYRPQWGECIRRGSLQQLQHECEADSRCVAFMLRPEPNSTVVSGSGVLKQAFDPARLIFNPNIVLYVRQGVGADGLPGTAGDHSDGAASTPASGSSTALSAGAIAGIVVTACAVAALAIGCAWLRVRRGRRQHLGPPSVQPTDCKQDDSSAPCGGAADEPSSGHGSGGSARGMLPGECITRAPTTGGLWSVAVDPHRPGAQASPFSAPTWAGAPPPHAAFSGACSSGGSDSDYGMELYLQTAAAPRRSTSQQPLPWLSGLHPAAQPSSPRAWLQRRSLEQPLGAPVLPELLAHVAAREALAPCRPSGTSVRDSGSMPALPFNKIPPQLRQWILDPSDLQLLAREDGSLLELGAGASGRVYKALLQGELVAAKQMDLSQSPAAVEAFLTEALHLAVLRHPHIVALFGVTVHDGVGTVVMELCEGRDLHSALQITMAGSNPPARLFGWYRRGRRVAYELSRALNFLHNRGIVHMDIKSQNVLLTLYGAVRLADVAFSRMKTTTFLSDVPLRGTFAWIAPEVLLGHNNVTESADIFSCGVVMWEIITGERPVRGKLRMPRVPEECPQEVCDLMMQCLSQDPTARPTAGQLLRSLRAMSDASHNSAANLRASQAGSGAV